MTEEHQPPRPLLVGVAGGSGSGKTTVARKIVEGLPSSVVSTIQHDAYYRDRPDLDDGARAAVNYDHPDSLETELLVHHLQSLLRGDAVEAASIVVAGGKSSAPRRSRRDARDRASRRVELRGGDARAARGAALSRDRASRAMRRAVGRRVAAPSRRRRWRSGCFAA